MKKLMIALILIMAAAAPVTHAQDMFLVEVSLTKEEDPAWYNPISWFGGEEELTRLALIGEAGQSLPFQSLTQTTYLVKVDIKEQPGITMLPRTAKDGLDLRVRAIPVTSGNEMKIDTSVTYSYSLSEENDDKMRDSFAHHGQARWITEPGNMQRLPFTLRGDQYSLNVKVSPYIFPEPPTQGKRSVVH